MIAVQQKCMHITNDMWGSKCSMVHATPRRGGNFTQTEGVCSEVQCHSPRQKMQKMRVRLLPTDKQKRQTPPM